MKQFEGREWDHETQADYYNAMVNNQMGDFSIGNSSNPELSARDKINRAPKALGLIQIKPTLRITEAGEKIQNKYLFEDILTKQLLKYQLPSPLLPEQKDNKGMFNIKPYLELLRLIYIVGDLSRSEFYAFGVTMKDYHDFNKIVEKLKEYRKEAEANHISAKKHYHDYIHDYVTKLYADKIESNDIKVRETKKQSPDKFINTKIHNIRDYGDAFLRYLIGTGLVIVNKKLQVIVAPNRENDVKYILNTIPRDPKQYTEKEYNDFLFNVNTPRLLSDNREELISKLKQLDAHLSEYGIKTNKSYTSLSSLDLKKIQFEKEDRLDKLARDKYAKSLKVYDDSQINDVLDTFKHIKSQDYFDNPLYLEWNTWRALTMIDNGNIRGSFKTNVNGDPVNTAPGNTADIIGDYGDFNMICEVTLSNGKKQYEMENEPVVRHLGELRMKENGKETFGLFIAKTIQPSVITEFYYKHRIPTRLYGGTVEFIPLTIDEFCLFFKNVTKDGHKLKEKDIHQLHKKTIEFAESAEDEQEWHNKIRKYILSL
nr:AlwI family type II restriction endonuclease [Limosilactobacillus mucosae]